MLKFLENRDPQPIKRGKDIMRYESQSHLPNNRQFNSPLHQDALIQNDKPTYYITKKLPPIQIYNPLIQTIDSIERPEYIVKQKEIYIPRYCLFFILFFYNLFLNQKLFKIFQVFFSIKVFYIFYYDFNLYIFPVYEKLQIQQEILGILQSNKINQYIYNLITKKIKKNFFFLTQQYLDEYKTKGFKKKQGIFESYQHLLAQNKSLIEGIHTNKKPLSLPAIREHQKEQSVLNIPAQFSTRSQDRQIVDQSCFKSISRYSYLHYNRSNKSIQSKVKYITNKNTSSQKQRISHKLLTEDKGIQVNIEKTQSHKITEQPADYIYNFNLSYQQKLEAEEEKEKQMRQLSIFDKKIKEFREQQKQKLQKKVVS